MDIGYYSLEFSLNTLCNYYRIGIHKYHHIPEQSNINCYILFSYSNGYSIIVRDKNNIILYEYTDDDNEISMMLKNITRDNFVTILVKIKNILCNRYDTYTYETMLNKWQLCCCTFYPDTHSMFIMYPIITDNILLYIKYKDQSVYHISNKRCINLSFRGLNEDIFSCFYDELKQIYNLHLQYDLYGIYGIISGNIDKFTDISNGNLTRFSKMGKSMNKK